MADIDVVEEVMRTGYAGYDVVAAPEAWDVAFVSLRSRVKLLETPIAVEEFRALLLTVFHFTRDGHLAFWTVDGEGKWSWGSTGAHADAYTVATPFAVKSGKLWLEGHEVVDCAGEDLATHIRPAFTARGPGSLVIRLADAAPAPMTCRVKTATGQTSKPLTFRPLGVPSPPREGKLVSSEEVDGIPVIRIQKFDEGKHDEMLELVAAGERLRDEPVIVLDLRGNPGGPDTYAREFFLNLTAGPVRYSTINELTSTTTMQGTVNWAVCTLARPDLQAAGREAFEQRRTSSLAMLEGAEVGEKSWNVYTPEWQGRAPKPYAGRLVVLVDRGCGSACESFVMFARQLPGTLVVGENTAGVGIFGEIRRYRLPHSGMWMQAGRKWFQTQGAAEEAKEGSGFMPDLWLDTKDPRAAALDIARCLREKDCAAGLPSPR